MAHTMTTLIALSNDEGVIEELAMFTEHGAFRRDEGDWLDLVEQEDDDDDPIDGLNAHDATDKFVPLFDMAEDSGATLTVHDVL